MAEWSDEAVEAAMTAYRDFEHRDTMRRVYPKERMRAALSAADAVRSRTEGTWQQGYRAGLLALSDAMEGKVVSEQNRLTAELDARIAAGDTSSDPKA